jgi:hypothetical protein
MPQHPRLRRGDTARTRKGEGTEAVGKPSACPLARMNHHPILQRDERVEIL